MLILSEPRISLSSCCLYHSLNEHHDHMITKHRHSFFYHRDFHSWLICPGPLTLSVLCFFGSYPTWPLTSGHWKTRVERETWRQQSRVDTCWQTCLLAPLMFRSPRGRIFISAQPQVKTCASREFLYSASLLLRMVWMHTELIFSSYQAPQVAVKSELLQKNRRMSPGAWNTTCESTASRTTPHRGWRSGTAVCPGLIRSFWDQRLGFRDLDTSSISYPIWLMNPASMGSLHGFYLLFFVGLSDLCTGSLSQLPPSKSLSFNFNYIEKNILDSCNKKTKAWNLTMGKP